MEREELTEQLTNAELQKMLLEIEDLKHKCSRMQRRLAYLPLITALVTVGSLWIGIWSLWMNYREQQYTANRQEEIQKRQNDERKHQAALAFGTPLLQKHLDVYFETLGVASKIASSESSLQEKKQAEKRFKELLRGALPLVEDAKLNVSVVAIANCLQNVLEECVESEEQRQHFLESQVILFSQTAKSTLVERWGVNFQAASPSVSKMPEMASVSQ